MNKLLIIPISTLILSGCSLFPSAWKSARPPIGEPTPAATVVPIQTTEELDVQVTADLETEIDADLKQIDEDLKAIDAEVKNY